MFRNIDVEKMKAVNLAEGSTSERGRSVLDELDDRASRSKWCV